MKRILLLLTLLLVPATAQARHHHRVVSLGPERVCMDREIDCLMAGWDIAPLSDPMGRAALGRMLVRAEILPHPSGCPRIAFCGCGASIEAFGRSVRSLWLAANWLRFPPAVPGPGMAAVRRHHVMIIRQMIGPGIALVYDANSGGHRTRLHVRSLAGYSVRDPHGAG